MRWLAAPLSRLLQAGEPTAVITIADARGSTPRGIGTRMLVTAERFFGTIGGGRLEYDAMQEARGLLQRNEAHLLREVPLGPALGQCCGGHATVLIERASEEHVRLLRMLEEGGIGFAMTRLDAPARRLLIEGRTELANSDPPEAFRAVIVRMLRGGAAPERLRLADGSEWLIEPAMDALPEVFVFGAGHVGRALTLALSPLPCRVRLFDHRPELLEGLADGVEPTRTEHPEDRVLEAKPGAYFMVMTPSHDVDCSICAAVLKRGDFAFLGLIGSASKRARFEKRWRAQGLPEDRIARLVCPIGLPGITGKEPAVIAASAAAQLLQAFSATDARAEVPA